MYQLLLLLFCLRVYLEIVYGKQGQANEILPKKDQVCKSMVVPVVELRA